MRAPLFLCTKRAGLFVMVGCFYFRRMPEPTKEQSRPAGATFGQALTPVLALLVLIVFGLIVRPQLLGLPAVPLEMIFITAAVIAAALQIRQGHKWLDIQDAIVKKFSTALPAFFILFTIGIIISSWVISGTIPMLVYYGIKVVNPTYLYLLCFVVPAVFSTLTGTSYGSAGTIGVVLIGVTQALGGDLGIAAGAIIGGAYFGDKLSPLSDSTNIAALAADVDLFEHIHSMLYTTVPSATIAMVIYAVVGFVSPPQLSGVDLDSVDAFLVSLETIFDFNLLLLLPAVIVLVGSIMRKPSVPTLLASAATASVLALIFQPFNLTDLLQTLNKGFETATMVDGAVTAEVATLLDRGGLYALIDAIVIAFTVFVYIGTLDNIRAMPVVVDRVFRFAKSRKTTILVSLGLTAVTNAMTSNQYATSFIVGDAFKIKYDQLGINRKVLSRSIEDYGTMVESIVPWTVTALFMVATLGVPVADYWHWQLISLVNLVVAPTLVLLGIGMFYESKAGNES